MNRIGAKILSFFLTLCLVAAGLPFAAAEDVDSGVCGENLTWRLEENADSGWYDTQTGARVENEEEFGADGTYYETRYTLFIEGEGAMDDYNYNYRKGNKPPWRLSNVEISRVNVCEGVTHVGSSALEAYERLHSVTLPGTLESIGENAFAYCDTGFYDNTTRRWIAVDGIAEIEIPDTVTYIGSHAFAYNSLLESVVYNGNLVDVCMAGEETAHWGTIRRIREVFEGTPWYNNWLEQYYLSGVCGENATWRLEENEDGFWAYTETGERVENEEEFGADGTYYIPRYTLFIEGEGAMENYVPNQYAGIDQP